VLWCVGLLCLALGCRDIKLLSCFTFLYEGCQTGFTRHPSMSTPLLLELFAGFLAACIALWFVLLSRSSQRREAVAEAPAFWLAGTDDRLAALRRLASAYFLPEGPLANTALLLLRLTIGVMMIHHGQEKLADPQQFADTYVASLHLPFPLFFAYAAGFSELIGSWLLILGLFTPLGALAITGTMSVAAYQHILTAGLNIYVLELVVLYLGGSLALLLLGAGRISFDGAIVHELLEEPASTPDDDQATSALTPSYVTVSGNSRG
jgi:putative oxidoreductase